MCELTLSALGSARKNAAVTWLTASINSDRNPHGFGFYNGELVWKTVDRPADLLDLGMLISSYITTDVPIISHTRLASKGIELKEENNHPFETKDFVGAHNGTLYLKDEQPNTNTNDNTSRGSDSKRFFEMLQEEYTQNGGDFVKAIRIVMDKHKGKFAFLILEKPTNTYYIIRGKTADLHVSECFLVKGKTQKYIGFVVNTDKFDLAHAIPMITNIWGLQGEKGTYEFSSISSLSPETIYTIKNGKLKEVGELKENPLWVPTPNTNIHYGKYTGNTSKTNSTTTKNKVFGLDELIAAVVDFQNRHFLTPSDMDLIMSTTIGSVVADCDKDDLEYFIKLVMPALSKNKDYRKLFKGASIRTVPSYFYTDLGLEFPWMLNSMEEIKAAIGKYEQRVALEREQILQKLGKTSKAN